MKKIAIFTLTVLLFTTCLFPAQAEEPVNEWLHKYETPIAFTVNNIVEQANVVWPDGENLSDNAYTRWAKEEMNIVFEPAWISANNDIENQKLAMAIATNNLPDIIVANTATIAELVDAGMIMDISGLLKQYASPVTQYYIDGYQNVLEGKAFAIVQYNDGVYGLPTWGDPWSLMCSGIWMRGDILEKVGMDVPTTLEEYEAFLEAACKLDESYIGFVTDGSLTGVQEAVFNPLCAQPNDWVDKDGALVYGGIQPEVKKALEVLARWYGKGLLSKEFAALDTASSFDAFYNSTGISMGGPWHRHNNPLINTNKNTPDAWWTTRVKLEGYEGQYQLAKDIQVGTMATCINARCENPEAMIYLMNEFADSVTRDVFYIRDEMEAQGYVYKYPATGVVKLPNPLNYDEIKDENGKFSMKNAVWDYAMPGPRVYFNTQSTPTQSGFRGFFILERAFQLGTNFKAAADCFYNQEDPETTLTIEQMTEYVSYTGYGTDGVGWINHDAFFNMMYEFNDLFDGGAVTYDRYFGTPTQTYVEVGAYLDKVKSETYLKIIMGELPLDEFDAFVSTWLAAGGAQWTSEVNEWYQAQR